MATLYVDNVPDDLYKALRDRARERRSSMAAEIVQLLADNVVTASERKARQEFLRKAQRARARRSQVTSFPSSEEMQRQDRER